MSATTGTTSETRPDLTKATSIRRDALLSAIAYAGEQFLRADDWDAAVNDVLERMGRAAGVDRVYVFQDHPGPAGKPVASLRHEWADVPGARLLGNSRLNNTPYFNHTTEEWRERLGQGEVVTGKLAEFSPSFQRALRLLRANSFAAVPIFANQMWWGTLGFAVGASTRDWSGSELDLLRAAASILGAAIERRTIAQERAEGERFWALMSRLSSAGLQSMDEQSLLDSSVDQLAASVRAEHCLVILSDPETGTARPAAATAELRAKLSGFGIAGPPGRITSRLKERRQTLVTEDLPATGMLDAALLESLPIRAGIGVPMVANEAFLGAVLFGFTDLRIPTETELERAELATQQVAHFLSNTRLLESEKLARKQAETLQSAGQAIGSTLNLREVLERILSELQRVVPYDSASVQQLEGDTSVVIAGRGFPAPEKKVGVGFDIYDTLLPNAAVYELHRSVIVNDIHVHYDQFHHAAEDTASIRAWMGVPLMMAGRPIGMLTLDKNVPNFYTSEHARLAEAFGMHAAIAIENARLFEVTRKLNSQVWRQAQQLQQVIDAVTDGIVLLDAQMGVVLANPAFNEFMPALTGKSRSTALEVLCGQPIATFLQTETNVGWHEVSSPYEEGRIFAISSAPVKTSLTTTGWVISATDVTTERKQRQLRREQDRLATIGMLASGIAHDFNNILQGIIGFSDLLANNPEVPAQARHRLQLMAREGQRGADLIRLILEYGREVALNEQLIALDLELRQLTSGWLAGLQRPVQIALPPERQIWPVQGDALQLRQALSTLAADAAKYLPASQALNLRISNRLIDRNQARRFPRGQPGAWVVVEIGSTRSWLGDEDVVAALRQDLPLTSLIGESHFGFANVQSIIRRHRGFLDIATGDDGLRWLGIFLPAATEAEQPAQNRQIGQQGIPHGANSGS